MTRQFRGIFPPHLENYINLKLKTNKNRLYLEKYADQKNEFFEYDFSASVVKRMVVLRCMCNIDVPLLCRHFYF